MSDPAPDNRSGRGVANHRRRLPWLFAHPFQRVRPYLGSHPPQNNAGTGRITDITVPWTDTDGSTELLTVLDWGQAELFAEQQAHMADAAEPAAKGHGLER
jgi:hypothetical protein